MPPPKLCTDNGVMVAWAGIERMRLGLWEHLPVHDGAAEEEWVDVRPRWPLTDRWALLLLATVSAGSGKSLLQSVALETVSSTPARGDINCQTAAPSLASALSFNYALHARQYSVHERAGSAAGYTLQERQQELVRAAEREEEGLTHQPHRAD